MWDGEDVLSKEHATPTPCEGDAKPSVSETEVMQSEQEPEAASRAMTEPDAYGTRL